MGSFLGSGGGWHHLPCDGLCKMFPIQATPTFSSSRPDAWDVDVISPPAGWLFRFYPLSDVYGWNKGGLPLPVFGEPLLQVEEFLFMSEGKMERKVDTWIGAASAAMRLLYWSVVVEKELSRK